MDEVPDTALDLSRPDLSRLDLARLDLARLVDELTVLDQRRVDIGESLVHLEYLYSRMGARQQADAARKAFQEKYVGRIYELADGLRT